MDAFDEASGGVVAVVGVSGVSGTVADADVVVLVQPGGGLHRYDKTATIYLAGLHLAAIFVRSAR
ncbi:hypothetical protein AB0L14_17225 [Streptomyces sp. NPDC052727]|uniref:hypothetical protein n=1 Tax=Streptomyces sp. NPDC052727 TaxID=3154854 RepID=UPI0034426A89